MVRVGETLTANRGTWSPTPSVVTYQWRAEGRPIPGATSRTYKLTRAEHGKNISVEITGRKYAYVPATRRSAATDTVKWPVGVSTPNVTSQPTRVVDTTPGTTVTLKVSATGGRLSYQWQRWTPASGTWSNVGSNSSTYRFTAATAHELNRFRVVVSNMVGKDTSNRTYMWVQSSQSSPFQSFQWFGLWNYNAVMSDSADNIAGYLAVDVAVCAAPGYYATGDLAVQFIGSNGRVYPGAGQEQPGHISNGVVLDSDGCGQFRAFSEAPQSVRAGGRWRITDRSDGQVYHQYVKYVRADVAANAFGTEPGLAPVDQTRAQLTD
jgi:plastocyanin